MSKPFRSGDVNLIPIKEFPKNAKEIEHNGSWILAKGEATGSIHLLKVKERDNLIIKQDPQGNMYFEVKEDAEASHSHDHETITINPGIYKQIPEREKDWFAEGIVRKVID